jgi:cytochrome P450
MFAMAEAQIMLATVLHRFAVSMAGTRPVLPVGRLTIQPDHAAQFRVRAPRALVAQHV